MRTCILFIISFFICSVHVIFFNRVVSVLIDFLNYISCHPNIIYISLLNCRTIITSSSILLTYRCQSKIMYLFMSAPLVDFLFLFFCFCLCFFFFGTFIYTCVFWISISKNYISAFLFHNKPLSTISIVCLICKV